MKNEKIIIKKKYIIFELSANLISKISRYQYCFVAPGGKQLSNKISPIYLKKTRTHPQKQANRIFDWLNTETQTLMRIVFALKDFKISKSLRVKDHRVPLQKKYKINIYKCI